MMLYADPSVIKVRCPACNAEPGVWCGMQKVHERRIRLAERVEAAIENTQRGCSKKSLGHQAAAAVKQLQKGTTDMAQKETRLRIIDAQIERLESKRLALAARPEDDFDQGAIVAFDKQFDNADGPKYAYIAVKGGAVWWVSGRYQDSLTWDELLDLAEKDGGTVDGLWYVTAMEQFA